MPKRALFATAVLLGLAAPVWAQQAVSGQAISKAIAGNTIRGHMVSTGGFEEFYDPSGAVRGGGYSGTWSVDGNRLCLSYDGDPKACWALAISGNQVVWIGSGGEEGTGTILPGNPKGF